MTPYHVIPLKVYPLVARTKKKFLAFASSNCKLRGVKRITVRGDFTMFRGTFKFDNFYYNYHIEANQVNFSSPFSRFELRTPGVHYSVPLNVWTRARRKWKKVDHWGLWLKKTPAIIDLLHDLLNLQQMNYFLSPAHKFQFGEF